MFSQRTNWQLAPNKLAQTLAEIRTAGRAIIDLTISNPTEVGIKHDRIPLLVALANPGSLHYDPQPRGLRSARRAVCSYYSESQRIDFDPERLLLTTSTSEAYSYVFRLLCNPGDEVLVPKPSYPLFEFLAGLADVALIPYSLFYDHGWQIDFDSLHKAATPRTKAVIVVHPNNPTGSYVSSAEVTQLNEICRESNCALIADEVFLDYAHDGITCQSFVSNNDALTFTMSGVSKVSALPQMKLAWLATSGPHDLVAEAGARLEIIADTFLSMNAPVQLAAPALLEQRRAVQPVLLDRVRTNLAELDRQLLVHKSCRRLAIQGGWYAVLRVPAIESDEDLAIRLLRDAGVSVHPGHFYDFPDEGYLVLSLINDPSDFREGIRSLLGLIP